MRGEYGGECGGGRWRVGFPMVSLEFSIDFRLHNGPEFDSASNINEHQEYFLVVKAVEG